MMGGGGWMQVGKEVLFGTLAAKDRPVRHPKIDEGDGSSSEPTIFLFPSLRCEALTPFIYSRYAARKLNKASHRYIIPLEQKFVINVASCREQSSRARPSRGRAVSLQPLAWSLLIQRAIDPCLKLS